MKKRRILLCLLLTFCMVLACVPAVSAATASGVWGNQITWTFNQDTGHLTVSGAGNMPSDDSPGWGRFAKQIRTVEIRSGVTDIGRFAFYGCTKLKSISIPETVREIGYNAFVFCESLSSVKLPSGLTSLAPAFEQCTSLTSIDIPRGVTTLGGDGFWGCTSLRQITLHTGLREIGKYAFRGLPITSIEIPATVKSIGESAFENCASLSRVTLAKGLETIGERAFTGCSSLQTITLPSTLRSLHQDAFLFTALKTVIMRSQNCKFVPASYSAFGEGNAVIYGYPDSTAQYAVAHDPNGRYTFKPMYFEDVAPGKWYFDAVAFAKEHSLFQGVGNGNFAPEKPMTRAMLVQVLYNYAGSGRICENTFTDVPDKAWYARAVAWAAEEGIVTGVRAGVFDPNANVTREQLAVIVCRFTQKQGIDVSGAGALSGFPDADKVSKWARDAVAWAVDRGILTGSKEGGQVLLQPRANATRAEVAAIMMRCVNHWSTAKKQ